MRSTQGSFVMNVYMCDFTDKNIFFCLEKSKFQKYPVKSSIKMLAM